MEFLAQDYDTHMHGSNLWLDYEDTALYRDNACRSIPEYTWLSSWWDDKSDHWMISCPLHEEDSFLLQHEIEGSKCTYITPHPHQKWLNASVSQITASRSRSWRGRLPKGGCICDGETRFDPWHFYFPTCIASTINARCSIWYSVPLHQITCIVNPASCAWPAIEIFKDTNYDLRLGFSLVVHINAISPVGVALSTTPIDGLVRDWAGDTSKSLNISPPQRTS